MKKLIRCFDHYGKEHNISAEKFVFRASAYGVLSDDNTILMVQERWSKLWEFPGGGVKTDERIDAALKREFLEETGLKVRISKLFSYKEDFFYAEDRDQAWHSLRFIFLVTKASGTLNPHGNNDDIIAARFIEKKNLSLHNTKPAIYSLLKSL